MRTLFNMATALLAVMVSTGPIYAEPLTFDQGFAALRTELGDVMGDPLEAAHAAPSGGVTQATTTGLAYWTPDVSPSFTDGWQRWALLSSGVEHWEGDGTAPPPPGTPEVPSDASTGASGPDESPRDFLYAHYANAAQIDCLISKESQWRDVLNAQGTGAIGYGQYMLGTWQRYQAESGQWDASPHNLYDVFAAMAWDLTQGRRAQWTVLGC